MDQKVREVLEFYANERNWKQIPCGGYGPPLDGPAIQDRGEMARKILEERLKKNANSKTNR